MSLPLLALFLTAFAFGTAEFVIAGILPEVADGLGITVPVAGYLISGYALGIAVGGPILALLSKKMSRKTLILLLGGVFILGHALCAIAPTFELLMLARLVVAVVHGTYFGIAAIVAVGLVPPERRGFAVALILSGLTVSNILGVPLGTAIGTWLGWRATFWAVGVVGLLATLIIAVWLPTNAGNDANKGSMLTEFKALGRQQVVTSLLIAVLSMIGQYSLFTYIAPLLRDVTGLDVGLIPWILLLYGVGATIGVFIGGRLADWSIRPAMLLLLCLQVLGFTGVYFAAPYPILMAVTVILWGGVNFAVGSPLQSRILSWAADAPNLASTLIPTGFNIGIAVGAYLGASMLENGYGYGDLPLVGSFCMVISALIAVASFVWEDRVGDRPPTPIAA
jgi:DHA1 family inner membrane transport protein